MYIIIAGSYKTDQQSSKGTQVSKPLGQTLKHESLGQPLGFKWRPFCLPDLKPPELSIGSPRHDFIDSGKSRMKRHAYAISGIQPLEHISRALSKPSSIRHALSSKPRVAAGARHRGSCLLLPFAGRGLRKAPLLISRHFVHMILHGGMTRQCLSVHLVELLRRERQSHAQHVRLTASDEVLPSGQILEGGHGEAL